jgi:xylulose-5-phosphate/fructose-6-phosphate phosphoketolase
MVMLNDLDRYHLVIDVIDRVPHLRSKAAGLRQRMVDARIRAREHTRLHGEDIPEVRDWVWPDAGETGTEASGPAYSGQGAGATATGGDNE